MVVVGVGVGGLGLTWPGSASAGFDMAGLDLVITTILNFSLILW